MLERLARDKHSSLLLKFVNHGQKSFIRLIPGVVAEKESTVQSPMLFPGLEKGYLKMSWLIVFMIRILPLDSLWYSTMIFEDVCLNINGALITH
jgi:hypothetical protein